jgi:hypothetical protein
MGAAGLWGLDVFSKLRIAGQILFHALRSHEWKIRRCLPNAWVNASKTQIGYEISFTRSFD